MTPLNAIAFIMEPIRVGLFRQSLTNPLGIEWSIKIAQLSTLGCLYYSQCMHLCENLPHGRMSTIRSPNETNVFFDRVDEVLTNDKGEPNAAGLITGGAWTPMRQASDGSGDYFDVYTKEKVN